MCEFYENSIIIIVVIKRKRDKEIIKPFFDYVNKKWFLNYLQVKTQE
jgi:hypothetical protein